MKYFAQGRDGLKRYRVEISADRFAEIRIAKDQCVFGLDLEEKLALLFDNYFEFESELLRLALRSAIWPRRDHDTSMGERLLLDRRIVNLLTACRLYLDQTDHGISGMFGNPSSQLSNIKKFKNKLYDSHQGYRVMEALRNHVQHAGMLIHTIYYSYFAIEPNSSSSSVQTAVIPKAHVSRLAENPSFKATVLEELQENAEDLDLREPIREYVDCFRRLHDEIRMCVASTLSAARSSFEKARADFSRMDDVAVTHPTLLEMSDGNEITKEIYLGNELLQYYDALAEKNQVVENLTRYSSSNVIRKKA